MSVVFLVWLCSVSLARTNVWQFTQDRLWVESEEKNIAHFSTNAPQENYLQRPPLIAAHPHGPWLLASGLEYRDRATIEAAQSVARFARTNQYLGSFKTTQGELAIKNMTEPGPTPGPKI